MAYSKGTVDDLLKKYGASGSIKPTTTQNNKGKQSNSSAPVVDDLINRYASITTPPRTLETARQERIKAEAQKKADYYKSGAKTKTTITSNLSDKERKARIKAIDAELSKLNSSLSGYSRARAYSTGNAMKEAEQKVKDRIAELSQEKKTLERVGTFSASELKQFEIEDAKAKISALPNYSPTARVSPSDVEAYRENLKARSEIDEEINLLERDQAEYRRYEKLNELNAHTQKVMSNKDFDQNSKYSPAQPKTAEQLKAEGYKQDTKGNWYKEWGFGSFREGYTGEDSDLYTYINDESKRTSIEVDKQMVTGTNTYRDMGYHTLTDEEKGAFNYLYHQDRKNGTKTAEEYLRNISPLLQQRAMELEAKHYAEISKEAPVLMSGISLGTNLQNAFMFPAKAVATATGVYDDMPLLDTYGNRTQAIREGVSEDMPYLGKLAYNGAMSIGDMGVAMLAGGGNAKVVQAIMSSSAGSSTISESKKNGASDGKALAMGLGSAAIEWATEKYSVEAILKKPESILGYISTNILTEGTEEGASNVANIALDAMVSEVFGDRNEIEQRVDYLVLYKGKTEEEALNIAFVEKLQSLGEDVLVGALTGAGMSSGAATVYGVNGAIDKAKTKRKMPDTILEDDESLTALIEEGKASGEGSESAKIATEIETARANGEEVTRDRVKKLIKANDKAIKAEEKAKTAEQTAPTSLEQVAREVVESRNREANTEKKSISVAEAKKATGYGDAGSVLVAKLATNNGVPISQVKASVETAYKAGLTGLAKSQVNFVNDTQRLAFEAGRNDRAVEDRLRQYNARNIVVNKESGFITENYLAKNLPSDVTSAQVQTVDLMAKALGVKAYMTTGLKGNAEINRATGEVPIDVSFEREVDGQKVSIVFHAAHEMAVHRVVDLAPEEGSAFVYELYRHLAGSEHSTNTLADEKRSDYAKQGVEISLAQAMEEVSANNILKLYNNNEVKFHNAIESIVNGTNTKAKQGLRKYIDYLTDIIRKIREALTGKSAQERAEIQTELNEIRKLRDMFETAFAKAVENRKALESGKAETNTKKNLEIKTNEEYNGNISHSLKDGTSESDQYGTMWTLEEEVLTRSEVSAFYDKVSELNTNTYKSYKMSQDGDYIFEIGNKLIYTDGYYDSPTIYQVITFDTNNETILGDARGFIYDAEETGAEQDSAFEIIEIVYGEAFARTASYEDSRAYERENGRGEGTDSSETNRRSQKDVGDTTSYSLKDSEGNTLTEVQAEYFKDSKVRDDNGNLLVMYQGASEDFTVFDRKKSNYANLYGRGFYFTNSEKHASQYGNTKAYYLDIKHPVSTTETTITKAQLRKFLEAVTENEDYSFENYGYGATVDSVLESTYGKSDFLMLNDVSQTAIGDLVEAVELFNEVNGTDYDGIILATETITFNSEQAKLTTNEQPTSNPDTRFSLKQSVEETKDLVAVHNLWEEKLLKSLNLGGLPMPSIAIVKAREGHSNFGNISLVFRKETISPTDRRNKVYSGDAWTPTYPRISYKLNEKEQSKIEKKMDALVPRDVQRALGGLYLDSYNMEDALNRSGDLASRYNYNYAMKYAFLRDSGVEIELPMKNASLSSGGNRTNEAIIKVAETVPEEVLRNAIEGDDQYKSESAIRKAVSESVQEKYKDKPEILKALKSKYDEELSLGQLMGYAEDALRYKEEGIKQEVDYKASSELIDQRIDTAKYEKWLKGLFSNIVAKEGIRNDKDLFTPSGNRRSFEALHYEHTLENVVKAMKEQGTIGIGGFGGNTILGSSAVEYGSISEIKEKANERMVSLPQEEYDKIREGFTDRFLEIASSLPIHKDSFSATDDAANMLCEAVMKYKTKSGMANYLRSESKGWANYSDHVVDDLVDLVNDIRNMPTSYFEAKPQRAVGFNEIVTAIIPDNASEELKTKLAENNVQYIEYAHGDNDARVEALNSLEDVKFSLKGTSNLNTKDRKQLLDIIEHLKGEFELTKFAKADPKKLAKMTKEVLKDYTSQANFDETYKAIDELYTYMANGEDGHPAVWDDVYYKAYEVAQEIIENALVVDDSMYNEYKHLRDYLRNTAMRFDSEYDSSPIAYENYNDFRKSNFGRLKFTKDGLPIDTVYQELAGLYPEFFNEERDSNTADQLERIMEVFDSLQPTEFNPFDGNIRQASTDLANDLISRFFDIPQAKPTFADKAERRVVEAKVKGANKVEAVRQQRDEKIKKLIALQREKTQKQLDKVREQRDAKVKKEQEKRREAIERMSESQKAKVYRAKIERHVSDLSKKLVNPTDKQHIPQELQGAVATLLESINLESNYTYDPKSKSYKKNDEGLPTRRTQAFNDLRKVYESIASSAVVDPDLLGENGWLSDVISLADKRIVDMNSSELHTVWQAIRAIEASVNASNKAFSEGKFATILEYAEALREDNAGKKEKTEYKGVLGKGKKLTTLDMLTPETYFHMLGGAGDSIFRMMRDAQDKHIRIMKEVADFTHKTLKDVDVNSLEKTLHTVKLGGEDVKLSTAQLMELYVLMKREQAVEHILVGGILPDITEGKGVKLNTKAEPIRNLSIDEIATATANLTDEQKKIADSLQKYVSTVLSDYGNDASMKVYNYEKFLEKNYWTIRTNRQEIVSEVGKDTTVTSVANKGMAKGTKPHANNSVRIGSIFDTFASHSSDMATYAAWLGTSEDVNRIRNFSFWEDGARKGTVKGILDRVHGINGSEYLQKLLTDVAIGVKGADNMNPLDKLIGNYKAASVGANLRVVIQQPTALLRALDMIDGRYMAEGTTSNPLKGWEKAKKYAPIAQWKDWGHFDINTGRQMKDVLFDNASLLEKTKQAGMWGASMADSLAWGQLWNAVEAETKAKHKELEVGTEAYYETVAKRFTEIVDHTQVVDGILQRSQIMRSPDALTKMATSFMGEPTKQYNMAVASAYDFMTGKGDVRKKAASRLGRTAVALAVAGIVNAVAQSIIDAMRDDDKEKDYWEKWLKAFVGYGEDTKFTESNLAGTVNPLNYIPFAKDIVSIFDGYDVKRMDTEAITKTINAATNMYKSVTGEGKYTIAEASAQLFAEVARLYGLPVANVKRDVKSLVTMVAIESDSYLLQYRMEKAMLDINYSGNSKNFMDILFNAYNNDREAYEYIYYDLIENGYDADKIKSGMETRMKKAEGVKDASNLSKRYMTPTVEKKYDKGIKEIKSSQAWKSATLEQKKEAKDGLYDFLTSTSESVVKTREEAKAAGVDETEYALWQLAIEMADQPKGEKGHGSYDYTEKAEAINSLELGDSEIAYFFGKGLYGSAKEELNEVINDGIDIQEYVNFKAATSTMKADKNANGKSIPNSKKRKVVNYLNNADLTDEEWRYFYYEIMNYKK